MDTSKEYVKMCEKAMPDLEGDEYEILSLNVKLDIPRLPFGFYIAETNGRLVYATKGVILYAQDQLQEMVFKEKTDITSAGLVERFNNCLEYWCEVNYNEDTEIDGQIGLYSWSMEQLWLAFVMKEKHNKTWDKKEWVSK